MNEQRYHNILDFDDDGDIGIFDLDRFAQVWGKTYR
jgi:hypothetical protein